MEPRGVFSALGGEKGGASLGSRLRGMAGPSRNGATEAGARIAGRVLEEEGRPPNPTGGRPLFFRPTGHGRADSDESRRGERTRARDQAASGPKNRAGLSCYRASTFKGSISRDAKSVLNWRRPQATCRSLEGTYPPQIKPAGGGSPLDVGPGVADPPHPSPTSPSAPSLPRTGPSPAPRARVRLPLTWGPSGSCERSRGAQGGLRPLLLSLSSGTLSPLARPPPSSPQTGSVGPLGPGRRRGEVAVPGRPRGSWESNARLPASLSLSGRGL